MSVEIRKLETRIDVGIAAGQISRNGGTARIEPCDIPNPKTGNLCPFRDRKEGILCKQEDGLLPDENIVFCPLQKGKLKIVPTKKKGLHELLKSKGVCGILKIWKKS